VLDLTCSRFLVDATLSTLPKLEVLDGIGNIDATPIDACIGHCPIEELASGPYERSALPVLLVPWLLADKSDRGTDGTFARNRARRARHQRLRCGDDGIERVKRLGFDVPLPGYAARSSCLW
jgi:hypothetical protein